jgi:uncharacterized protein YcnI
MPLLGARRLRPSRRVTLIVAIASASVPLLAQAASAHVVVSSPDAVRGGETALVSFRVPNESPTAETVKVRIDLPVDAPVAEVLAQPLPGWTLTTSQRSLAAPTKVGDFTLTKVPASVTWTASAGTSIAPGQFQIFDLVTNPVPDKATLTFAATQTYSDGQVVHWNQPTPAGGTEPDHPAPQLTLAAAGDSTPTPSASATGITVSASPIAAGDTPAGAARADSVARWLAGAAVLVAVGCLVVVLTRRRPS